jgi:hypothetical protein
MSASWLLRRGGAGRPAGHRHGRGTRVLVLSPDIEQLLARLLGGLLGLPVLDEDPLMLEFHGDSPDPVECRETGGISRH